MKKVFHPLVAAWLLFSLICGFLITQSKFTTDMSAFLPRNPSPRQQILIDQISEGFASRSLIVAVEDAPPEVLAQLSINLGQALRASTLFSNVNNGQADAEMNDQEFIFANRYTLSPGITADRMTATGLRQSVQDTLAEISSSTGLFSKNLLARDPTGETLEVIKRVVPTSQPLSFGGVWMNKQYSRALLLLQTTAQGSDLDAQQNVHASIEQSFKLARQQVGLTASQAVLKYSGPGVFAVKARETIKTEASSLSTIGILLVLGLLWFIYRSIVTLFLGVLPVVTGALAGIAAVGLGFPSVHGMTIGFGITLIGEAVDYAIYLFVQYTPKSVAAGHENSHDRQKSDSFRKNFWPTIRLGVITSIFGFSTLLFSGFTGLAQLGLFSIVGIVVAAVVTRFVLPLLLPANFTVHQPKNLGLNLSKFVSKLHAHRGGIVLLGLLAAIFVGLNWKTLWSNELGTLSPVPLEAQQLDAELRADMGASDSGLVIALKAESSEQVLQMSEVVAGKLELLISSGEIGGYQAPTNYLPSQRTQAMRKAALPETSDLQKLVDTALAGLPVTSDKLQGFFIDVASAKNNPLLTQESLKGTSMFLGVDSLLTQNSIDAKKWSALIVIQAPIRDGSLISIDSRKVESILASITPMRNQEIHVIELGNEARSVYKAYLKEAIFLSAAGLLSILTLFVLVKKSARQVARILLPLMTSVIVVAASVVILNGSLNLLHLVGLLLVVAIGSNYALFFDQRSSHVLSDTSADQDKSMLCSLFFANLTTILGFGLLAFSSVPVMNAIGFTVGLGTFLALAFSAAFAMPPSFETKAA
jgi:predicted exporter